MWVQIIVSVFIAAILWRLALSYKNHTTSLLSYLGWSLLWVGIAIIFWWPGIASRLALAVGIGRGADLFIYLSIIVLLYLVYRIFLRLEKMNRDITALTRELSLAKKNDASSDSNSDRRV